MISRTLSTRLVLGPMLGIAGFALAMASSTTASAQGDAPAAGSAAPPAAAGSTTAPAAAAPAATTPAPAASAEDPTKKKSAAPAEGAGAGTPAAGGAAAPATTESGATVTFGTSTTDPTKKDEPSKGGEKEAAPALNPLQGSFLLFDQSTTTNSLYKGSQLSYVPVYEWWISPRVYYNFSKQFKVGIRQDVFKEWTNTEETTSRSEWRIGDPWLTASYADKIKFISDKLRGNIGWVLKPGISKESRGAGQYFSTGPSGSVNYAIPLTGEKGKVFKTLSIGAVGSYSHAFTRCTTACRPGNELEKSTASSGTSGSQVPTLTLDDQIRSGTLSGNTLFYGITTDLEVADGLDLGISQFWISSFAYALPQASNGGAIAADNTTAVGSDDTRVRQLSWFMASIDYELVKYASLSLGYYNLASVLTPDSHYRQPFWSPDARLFFSVEFKIDALYDKFYGKKEQKPATAMKKTGFVTF